jgi:hypothetical protein
VVFDYAVKAQKTMGFNEGHGFTRAAQVIKVTGFSRCGTVSSRVAGGFRLCRKSSKNEGLPTKGTGLPVPHKLLK